MSERLFAPLAAVLGLLALGGPAHADWTQFRGDASLTGVAGAAPATPLEPRWRFEAGDAIESTAAISDGTVFVGSLDGKLYALDLASGRLRWTYETEAEIKSSPSVRGGVVYFGDESGIFHALDAETGKARWTFETDGGIISSANFSGDLVLFGSYDNHLYALDRETGSARWKVETDGYIHASPAIAGDYTLVSGCDGFFRKIALADGSESGKLQLGSYVASSMAVRGNVAYTGTFDNEVLAVDWKNEELLWRYSHPEKDFPFYSSAAVTDDVVVIGGRDKLLHALDPATGESRWTFPTRSRVDPSPVIAGDRVFALSGNGDLHVLELGSGKELWRYEIAAPVVASPAVGADYLVVSTDDGEVLAFSPSQARRAERDGS